MVMATKVYFIFCTLCILHKFKKIVNMLKTNYYNFNVHAYLYR